MLEMLVQHQVGVLAFVTLLLLNALGNWRALRRLEDYGAPLRVWPRVSVVVPARNEAAQIADCVHSLLALEYPNFRVMVLDDHSTDATYAILARLGAADSRLTVLQGASLPVGWVGKNWACEQLARAADGELLLFTDADTRHHPAALRNAVAALQAEHADLVTALPREDVVSWGERLLVPFMSWTIFALLPIGLAHRLQWAPLSATIGQFMLFRRKAYQAIGGHASVRQSSVDDLALGRRILAQGWRWRLVDGGTRVRCRMYTDWSHALEGFSRHLFAVFGYNAWLAVPAWLWVGLVFIEPFAILLLSLTGVALPVATLLALVAITLSLALWTLFCLRLRFPIVLAVLYPVSVLIVVGVALRSIVLARRGRAVWKGRILPQRGEVR